MKSQYENDMKCRLCMNKDSIEDENHIFKECIKLLEDDSSSNDVSIDDIFGNLDEQTKAIKYFAVIMKKRDLIMEIEKL